MPFIVRNPHGSEFLLQDAYLDQIFQANEHIDLEQVFGEDQLYLSSVSPHALYDAINSGNLIRRNDADDTDIDATYAFDDAIWRWSPTRGQKEALVGTSGSPSVTNKYVTNDDSRNTNNRYPLSHKNSHLPSGDDALATGIAVSITTTNGSGSAESFSKSDHTHQGVHSIKTSASGTSRYGDITFIEGSGVTLTDNSGQITFSASGLAVPYGTTTTTLVPDAVMTAGSAIEVTRADHGHAIAADAPSVDLSAITINTEGSSSSFSRADHGHAITTGIAVGLTPDQTSASGTSASLSRADHVHNIPTGIAVTISTTNGSGTAATFSHSDHVHAHGSQTDGTLHATATSAVAGFLSSTDKSKLNSLLRTAAGTITAGSFTGNPRKYTVTFPSAFSSTSYAISIVGADNRNWSWEAKTTGGFVINANAGQALTGNVDWTAVMTGEENA